MRRLNKMISDEIPRLFSVNFSLLHEISYVLNFSVVLSSLGAYFEVDLNSVDAASVFNIFQKHPSNSSQPFQNFDSGHSSYSV